ncbi:hypothetical protein ACFLT9_04540 [Acidobacteriota bacterium]
MGELKGIIELLIPIFLYAEVHSKLPFIPNFLNNKLPEIIADAPHRIDKYQKLPILILIKDSHLYPLELLSIRFIIKQAGETIREVELLDETLCLSQKLWYRFFDIDPRTEGWIDLDIVFTVKHKKKIRKFKNNSYRTAKRRSLNVYISSEVLPDRDRIQYGDIHYHSFFTEDILEFGAPIDAAARMAEAAGLSFFAVTDHSYDLDDEIPKPEKKNPDPQRWQNFLTECDSIKDGNLILLPGIEVSAGNKKGENVHLLILNPERFYPGHGDGAEVRLEKKPDRSVSAILKHLNPSELAIAAHPFRSIFFLEKWLLRRGNWSFDDTNEKNLAGLQIFNGIRDRALHKSIKRWVEILLKGHIKFIYAGNDAHGGFNRYLQIRIPFVYVKLDENRIFGLMKTGVYANGSMDRKGITDLLRRGRCFVTTGPSLFFYLFKKNRKYFPGDVTDGRDLTLVLEAISIKEYGDIKSISIILGDLVNKIEKRSVMRADKSKFFFSGKLPFTEFPLRYYIRIVCEAENGIALSNPIWVECEEGKKNGF